jgi:hypothetical protein
VVEDRTEDSLPAPERASTTIEMEKIEDEGLDFITIPTVHVEVVNPFVHLDADDDDGAFTVPSINVEVSQPTFPS